MADLNVKFFGPPKQFSLTFTSSDSIMLQHCPIDVTGLGVRTSPVDNGGEGTAYDSQNPRQAKTIFVISLGNSWEFNDFTICINCKLYTIWNFNFSSVTCVVNLINSKMK